MENNLPINSICMDDVSVAHATYVDNQRRSRNSRTIFTQECVVCGRGITEAGEARAWWVHMHTDWFIMPNGSTTDESHDQGWFPVGTECAKKIPLTHRERRA